MWIFLIDMLSDKKPDTKEYILCGSVFIKFKMSQN